ncbi:21610_t:CDS:2, partial [Rhizophagus irregularis]
EPEELGDELLEEPPSDPNNLSQLQKGAFLAFREINNYIVTGPSTMTFEESQQFGFTDKCRSLHLEFMLNDFIDEGLLEFFYSQISSTSRCLINFIRNTIGIYPEYRRFFTIQRIIKAPPSYVYQEFEYYKQISTNQAIFRQLPVSAAKRINCMAISLKTSLKIADSVDLTNNYQSIMDPQSVLVISKIKPCKRCEYLYNINYEEIDAKQMDEYFIMCNCAESEGSIHLEAPQTKSRLQEYTDLIVDFFGNREYLIFISVNLFANFFRKLIRN